MKKNKFIDYLKTKYNYANRTLQEKNKQIGDWKALCLDYQQLENLTQKELLKLIEIQKRKYKAQTLNNHLNTIEQYYTYLIEVGKKKDIPIKNFRIKTETHKIVQGLLTEQELTQIYNNYSNQGHLGGQFNHYRQRNKVILGLMIYQGLDSSTLEKLKLEDINLDQSIIQVPKISEHKLQERILPLESHQILELHNYITHTREALLVLLKVEENTKKLFPKSEKTKFSSITQSIKKQINIENLIYLRYSRITIWKKRYNLRQTQYKAGYKSILSLEKFNQEEIEKLKQSIEKYHPL